MRDGDGWVINGTKIFISNAGTDMCSARRCSPTPAMTATGTSGQRRLHGPGTPGYTMGQPMPKLGWHAMDTRELIFSAAV